MSPTKRAVSNSSSTSSTSAIDEHVNKKAKHLSNIDEGFPPTDKLEHASLPTPSSASAVSDESKAQALPKDWEERLRECMRQDRESCRRRGEEELRKLGISPLPPIQLPTSDEERDEETRRFIRKRYGQDELPPVDDPRWKWELMESGEYAQAPKKDGRDWYSEEIWAKFGPKRKE